MPKYDKAVQERIEELAATGLDAAEIQRRLNNGAAGLPEAVPIGYRRTRQIVANWEIEHGPASEPDAEQLAADTAQRLKSRALALFQREVTALEKQRPGKMTAEQARNLRAIIDCAASVQKRISGDGRQRNGKRPRGTAQDGMPSAIAHLAEAMAKPGNGRPGAGLQKGHAEPQQPDTKTPETRTDDKGGSSNGGLGDAEREETPRFGGEPRQPRIIPTPTPKEQQGVRSGGSGVSQGTSERQSMPNASTIEQAPNGADPGKAGSAIVAPSR